MLVNRIEICILTCQILKPILNYCITQSLLKEWRKHLDKILKRIELTFENWIGLDTPICASIFKHFKNLSIVNSQCHVNFKSMQSKSNVQLVYSFSRSLSVIAYYKG